jgi:hypothetical protein
MPNGHIVDASELVDDNYVEIEPEDLLWALAVGLTTLRLSEVLQECVIPCNEYRASLSY